MRSRSARHRRPEATDEGYWDTFEVARIVLERADEADTEDDEERADEWHVLFPTRKESSPWGLMPFDGAPVPDLSVHTERWDLSLPE